MSFNWKKINVINNSNNKLLLMERPCPVCQHDQTSTVLTLNNFQFFSDSEHNPKQATLQEQICENCHALFLNPCYSNTGFSILFEEAGQSYGSTQQRPLEQFNWINDRVKLKNSSFLDIGCGSGSFLASLPNNIKKVGVDIDQQSIDIAKKNNSDITFICSAFENIAYDEPVDVMTMFHVLEHLQNPLQTLQRLHQIANDNTIFVIEVPIIENGLTNDINGFFSAQHLTHFSRNSFKNILALAGWKILEWQEQPGYNGCRVLAEKTTPNPILSSDNNQKYQLYCYLQNWYQSIAEAEKQLQKVNSKQCVIWGGGMHLEFIYQVSSLFNKDIEFIVVDKDKNKQGKTWRGIEIKDPSIIPQLLDKEVYFIASSYRNQDIIKAELNNYGVAKEKIITLYDHINVY